MNAISRKSDINRLMRIQLAALLLTVFWSYPAQAVVDTTGLLPISQGVSVDYTRFRSNRRTGETTATVTITNISPQAYTGPIYLVINAVSPGTVAVTGNNEQTVDGLPVFVSSAASLAPGEILETIVTFNAGGRLPRLTIDDAVFAAPVVDTTGLAPVNTDVTVDYTRFRTNRRTGETTATAAVANTGSRFLTGAVYLVIDAIAPDTVTAQGTSLRTTTGEPVYRREVDLAPGDTIEMTVVFVAGSRLPRLVIDDSVFAMRVQGTVNRPPLSVAGPDQRVSAGATVTLDGSASSDSEGDTLTFNWSIVSQPAASNATLSDAGAIMPTFIVNTAGNYELALTVNDGRQDSPPDSVIISTENVAPVANAGSDQSVSTGDAVVLDGSRSSDVDGDALGFQWSLSAIPTGSNAALSDAVAVQPQFVVDVPGEYVAQLAVNDGVVNSALDKVIITTGNAIPVANAGSDQRIVAGVMVVLDGTGSRDANGDPLSYRWSLISAPGGSIASLSDPTVVQPVLATDQPGRYILQLIVNDGSTDSIPDTVVISTQNTRPVARADSSPSVFAGESVQLDGRNSGDADNDTLDFGWSLIARPDGSRAQLSDTTIAQPGFIADLPGAYVGQLVVGDSQLNSIPDTILILASVVPPLAVAGPDQSVLVGETVTLDGSNSTSPSGSPLTYRWSITGKPINSNATLSRTDSAAPGLVADMPGTYLIQLIVNDGTTDSKPDNLAIQATTPFVITLDSPIDGSITNQPQQTLRGSVSRASQLSVNGVAVTLDDSRAFAYPATLREGKNMFDLVATETDGETAQLPITLILDTIPPQAPDESRIIVTTPEQGQATLIGDPGSVAPGSRLVIFSGRTNTSLTARALSDGSFSLDLAALLDDPLALVARDAADNASPVLNLRVGEGRPTLNVIGDKIAPLGQTLKFVVRADAPDDTPVELAITPVPLPANMRFDIRSGEFEFTPGADQVGDIALTFHARTRGGADSETINLSVPTPDPTAPTRFIGRVLDANELDAGRVLPVVGASVSFLGNSTQVTLTDSNGNFVLTNVLAGDQILEIDASAANVAPGGTPYASFREMMPLLANTDNIVTRPFSLPRISVASMTTVVPVQTTVVINPDLDISLTVPPNTAINEDGSQFVGELSISPVPRGLAPAALPASIDPALLITIQPVGVTFTQPVPITYPNFFPDLPPGSPMNIWALDPATGEFKVVGEGRISSDGQRVETVSGGIRSTTWGTVTPLPPEIKPAKDAPDDDNTDCDDQFGSTVNVQDGCLQTDFVLPVYRSLEQARQLRFVYKSRAAYPHPVLPFAFSSITTGSGARLGLSVGGVDQGEIVLGSPISTTARRNAVAFSANDFASGLYPYTVRARAKFFFSTLVDGRIVSGIATLSTSRRDEVRVFNEQNSDFGAGWLLDGVAKVHLNADGAAFITFGSGQTTTFKRQPDSNAFITPDGSFSTLVQNANNSFTLTDKFGIRTEFSTSGRQTARVDRNGNRTAYAYDSLDRLTTITDPVGKLTTLSYANGSGRLSTVTDPASRITQFEHNGVGDLTRVIFPDGASKRFQYDRRHLMTAETDERGNTTTRRYSAQGRAVTATLPDGSTRNTSNSQSVGVVDFADPTTGTELNPIQQAAPADAVNRLVDANGNLETSTTDKFGRKTKVTDALGRITRTERNPDGNPTKITRPNGSVVTMSYDSRGNKLNETEQFNNAITVFTYHPQYSLLESATDPRGNTTITIYDTAGNPIATRNALGHTTTRQYDSRGLVTQVTDPNGFVTTLSYNAEGLVEVLTQTPPDGAPARITRMAYDSVGRMNRLQRPDGEVLILQYDERNRLTGTIDNAGQHINFTYDETGNLIQGDSIDPDGTLVKSLARVFDTRNRLTATDNAGSVSRTQLDNNGNLTRQIDPNGNSTGNSYDAVNRLVESRDSQNGITRFTYDKNDKLVQVIAPNGAVTTFENDLLGRATGETSPDRGQRTSRYDKVDNVIDITDARGITANLSYDVLNRVTAITYPDATENVTFTYDTCLFGTGRLCARSDQSGFYTFVYDAFGNRIRETHTELGVTYTTRYTYDAGNNLVGMTLPGGRPITYTRDAVRRITSITGTINGTAQVIADDIGYRADNLMIRRRFGNSLIEQRRYDLQGRLFNQTLGTVDARSYRYDANGNILVRPATPQNKNWAYDRLDRLVTDATNSQAVQLDYDPNGNRLNRAANDASFNEVYAYAQAGNRLSTLDTLDNKAAHKPTTPPQVERTFRYNNAGRLFHVFDKDMLSATYTYNGNGLRSRKVTATGTTLYHYNIQGRLIAETREDGTPIREYIWQDNEPIAQIDIQGATESLVYLHTDHLLTPRLATDEIGIVAWRWEGEAFGQAVANEDPDGDDNTVVVNLRFGGQYYDRETGLHYNSARYYDPSTGRYLTSDPIGLGGGLNTYLYVGANSTRYIDPLGLNPITDFVREHGVVSINFNVGAFIGLSGQIFITETGVSGYLGAGFGAGTGVSLTAGLKAGGLSEWTVKLSASGGAGPGANAAVGLSEGGALISGGVGLGLGAGFSLTGGYTGTLINWGSPDPVEDKILEEFCKQNPSAPNCQSSSICK